jgi:putative intracellular protease/amidase
MTKNIKVVFVIANEGFQPVEFNVPKKLLEQSGITVQTASNRLAPAIAKDGSTTHVNYLIKNIPLDEIDGLFIVGGPGTLENLNNPEMYKILKEAVAKKLKVGAICIATRILAASGILEGKQATGWNGDNELGGIFKQHGVFYKNLDVVRDENILTATGPDAAREYGEQIVSMLD